MRRFVALAALLLIGCEGRLRPLEGELTKARQWLRTEQFDQVLGQADQWLQLAREKQDLKLLWRFRLVKAEALLGQERSFAEVLTLLTDQGDMPLNGELAG